MCAEGVDQSDAVAVLTFLDTSVPCKCQPLMVIILKHSSLANLTYFKIIFYIHPKIRYKNVLWSFIVTVVPFMYLYTVEPCLEATAATFFGPPQKQQYIFS